MSLLPIIKALIIPVLLLQLLFWQTEHQADLVSSIPVPDGFERVSYPAKTFPIYLRDFRLKPTNEVYLYDGRIKPNQTAQHRVLDIDVGTRDLQQCADATMRLWGEYLYEQGRYGELEFMFTSGDWLGFSDWSRGVRAYVEGKSVTFLQAAAPDSSYRSFRSYMNVIFSYCGTASLARQLDGRDINEIRPGDVFVQGGFPGHAVIVMDKAVSHTGEKAVLLAQSFMPAQDIHVLVNPGSDKSPWYIIPRGERLVTPEWTFQWTDLRKYD